MADAITVAEVVDERSCLRLVRAWIADDIEPCLADDPSGFMLGVQSAEVLALIDRILGPREESDAAE